MNIASFLKDTQFVSVNMYTIYTHIHMEYIECSMYMHSIYSILQISIYRNLYIFIFNYTNEYNIYVSYVYEIDRLYIRIYRDL